MAILAPFQELSDSNVDAAYARVFKNRLGRVGRNLTRLATLPVT